MSAQLDDEFHDCDDAPAPSDANSDCGSCASSVDDGMRGLYLDSDSEDGDARRALFLR